MHTLSRSLLARPLLAILAFVTALARYHWVRWVPGVPFKGAPRFFTVRCANAWSLHCGPLWLTVPMPWSRVFLTGTAISCPWMLPTKSGIRTALGLSVLLLLLSPVTAAAQVIAGTSLWFEHEADSALDTERYELCVDTVTDATCAAIGVVPVSTVAGVTTFRFTLPASVARGNRALSVRAVGKLDTGTSAPSNVYATRVIGKPGPPSLLRQTEVRP